VPEVGELVQHGIDGAQRGELLERQSHVPDEPLLVLRALHGGIGMYRLAIKWGWLEGRNPDASRRRLSFAKWGLTAFFLALGLLTLAAYYRIGFEIRGDPGIRYTQVATTHATTTAPRGGPR
jgi:hypothetical protein